MRRFGRTTALLAAATACTVATARAAVEPPPPRSISVTGEAEIKVAPDQVILTIAVETHDKDLIAAERDNDARVKKVLALAPQFKIAPRHVQTSSISIQPRYETYSGNKREFLGYFVNKTIVFCLRDIARFEDLLTAVLKAGVNNVDGVQFQNTELRKHRDAARAMAVRAAREKATAMAGELGQKLGRPRTISEGGGGSGYRHTGYQTQNVLASAGDEGGGSDSFAPGQISISASVSITFDLAD